MRIKTILLSFVALAMAVVPLSAAASEGEITYTCDTGKGSVDVFGTNKKETYNVAMHMLDNSLVGMTVKSVRVPVPAATITNLRVWLTKELKTKTENGKKTNDVDILTQTADAVNEGFVEVTLSEPYVITSDGLYVGYSFDITELDDNNGTPIQYTTETHNGGFYIFSSRTYKSWVDRSASGSLTMQVILSGAKGNAASISVGDALHSEKNSPTTTSFTINNHGANGVQSFDYTYEVNGMTGSSHIDLTADVDGQSHALAGVYNTSATFDATIPAIAEKGKYPLTLTVTKVNGVDNEDTAPATTTTLNVYNKLPKHRPLLEEYTGTWCGYCPRGFIGLMLMNKLYPEDFIGVSYHNGDAMEIMDATAFPSSIPGYPAAYLDRSYSVDAYDGFYSVYKFGIGEAWELVGNVFSPAAVDVKASLSDNGDKVNVESEVTFVNDIDAANYDVELMLIADDLHNDKWGQSNYYAAGAQGTFEEEEWKTFTEGASTVYGLHFDDVIVATTRTSGNNIALPSTIEEDKTYTAKAVFNIADVVNTSGVSLVQDLTKLRVVAVVTDKTTGAVVNANKANVDTSAWAAGISSLKADTKAPSAVYDLQGRRINAVKSALNIVKTSDGRTVKIVRK